jgi:serine/threonine-protein kinase
MYLDNQSRDSSDAYLADGLTEEITTKLGQVGRLAVTSNTTMRRYRTSTLEPEALGRALRVAQLVSGSVRRAGHRIRVNVELLRARDGVQIWADAYDRTDDDLLAIEEDVARQVATAIAGRLLPREQASLQARPTRSPEAYDHFLRGNFLIAQRAPASARRAIEEYQAAAALDPGFARAFGRLGLAYELFVDWGWPSPGLTRDSLLALGSAATDRALRLDSLSTDGWMARGYIQAYRHPETFEGVLEAYDRAVVIDPGNAEAHHQFAGFLMTIGRDSAAEREFRRALALDPTRAITWDNLASLLYVERRYDEARLAADSGLAADPQAYYLYVDRADQNLTRGDIVAARGDVEAAARTRPADYILLSDAMVAALEASAGDTAAARARLERLVAELPDPRHPSYTAAQWLSLGFLRSGDRERALALLEAARPQGQFLWNVLRDPGFDPLRNEPRFRALVERTRPPEGPR